MDPANQREEAIFEAAMMLPPEQRSAYLEKVCGGDAQLRERIENLLKTDERTGSFPEPPAAPAKSTIVVPLTPEERPGDSIGRYKVLQKIGEGGCGIVYMAEQEEPVRRRVALKIIRLGMDTRSIIARFEAERQALAMMDHPNIAKVLDAGATATGRPFFVMELVRGIKITDYCDQNRLATEERLKLFTQVCHAIQHAHQKGIIHRDIKPSNILVTLHDGAPVPKVIDFGIAKATQGRLTDQTLFTAFEQFIGTPAYMSPEQAEMSGLDIDTRSDIYALGVLLYELLTGQTPFDAKELLQAGLDKLRRIIREKEPARPSTRLSTMLEADLTAVAQCRHAEPPKLIHALRGDLDWIVMKCLEKDRTRRYETANGLALDLQRHLNNEPVAARPPSRWYRFQKSLRRNKLAYVSGAAIALALMLGIVATSWQAVRATRAKREAWAARAQALKAQANEAKQRAEAQQELYHSLVGQARATRLARRLGYRDRVFDLLNQAKALDVPQKDLGELRNEAVACLGSFVGLTPATFTNYFPTTLDGSACLAPSGKLAALGISDGTVQLLQMPAGKEVARLTGTNGLFFHLCFNPTSDQLFAESGLPTPGQPQFLESSPNRRVYSWACDTDGRWQETGNRALPGAGRLFNDGTEVLGCVVDLDQTIDYSPEAHPRLAEWRLFEFKTGAFVAGYQVTNAVRGWFDFWYDATPDARFLVTETGASWDPNSPALLELYDWKTGRRINQMQLPEFGFVSLSPDGRYLAWLSFGAGGALYTVPGFERIGQFKEMFVGPAVAVFSQNLLALPLVQQGRIRLWNPVSREEVALLDDAATPVAFSSDGNSLLTVGGREARLYQLQTPEKLDLPAHAAAVMELAFSQDSRRLASVGNDGVLRVCDAMSGRILWQTNDIPGGNLPIPGPCVCYSPDGQWLAAGGGKFNTARLWICDAQTGKRLLDFRTNVVGIYSIRFNPDGRYLATTGGDEIRVYSFARVKTEGGNDGWEAKLVKSSSGWGLNFVENLAFSPDGRFLSFTSIAGELFLWDFEKEAKPRKISFPISHGVEVASFDPEGRLLAMDLFGKVATLEVPSGKEIGSFQARTSNALPRAGICLSPDGSKLAVGSPSALGVDIWDPRNDKLLYSLPYEAGTVYWLAWSPDSRRLAIARDNGNIAIWNLDSIHQTLARLGLNP